MQTEGGAAGIQLRSGTSDFALIAHAAILATRLPFLHFFDGFRTSHEINKIEMLADEVLRTLMNDGLVMEHRARALSPDHPVVRGTAHNPDVFFQARERNKLLEDQRYCFMISEPQQTSEYIVVLYSRSNF